MNEHKLLLELFAGAGSVARVAQVLGYEIISVDKSPEYNPDILSDILDFDPGALAISPTIIWASPPCTCFSVAAIGRNWDKQGDNYIPKRSEAIEAVRIVEKTLSVFRHYPGALWYMENPRGILRKLPVVQGLVRRTVTYCQYGFDRMKPTDIWTNNPDWTPRPICKNGDPCHTPSPRGANTGTQACNLRDRWAIPAELIAEILVSRGRPSPPAQRPLWEELEI